MWFSNYYYEWVYIEFILNKHYPRNYQKWLNLKEVIPFSIKADLSV